MKQIIFSLIILFFTGDVMSQKTDHSMENNYYKKKMTPQGVEFVNTAPVSVKDSIVINVSVQDVWKVIDATLDFNKWFPGTLTSKFVDPNNKGLGAKRIAETKKFKYYEDIIIYEPNREWGFTILESNSGAFESIVERISLEKIDETTTKVIYQGGYAPNGIYKLLKGIIAKSVKKAWHNALLSLKDYTENNLHATEG